MSLTNKRPPPTSTQSISLVDSLSSTLFTYLSNPNNDMSSFLSSARTTMGIGTIKVRLAFLKSHRDPWEDSLLDGRYLLWIAEFLLFDGDRTRLDRWQQHIVRFLSGSECIMWRLVLQRLELTVDGVGRALEGYLGGYFRWPSFLRGIVVSRKIEEEEEVGLDSNKRLKGEKGWYASTMGPRSNIDTNKDEEMNSWWPLLGYTLTQAFLSMEMEEGQSTIHETLDRLASIFVPSLLSTLAFPSSDGQRSNAVLAGMAACVIDALGEALVFGTLSLRDDGESGKDEAEARNCSIFGAEVGQIVDLMLLSPGVIPSLAKSVGCPLSGIVAETADTLLNYSKVYHTLHHQPLDGSDSFESETTLQPLMAKDASKVLQFIDTINPKLKQDLSWKKFPTETYNYQLDDPQTHPIITYLIALLTSGDLHEGCQLCHSLEDSSGIHPHTETSCWVYLFRKLQEENALLEHDWNATPTGNPHSHRVTLANIVIGPRGRRTALEYLHRYLLEAKESLLPARGALSFRDKQYATRELLGIKDAIRRTVLKFLIPRPHPAQEAMVIAARVSEADVSPKLDCGEGSTSVEKACWILQQPSLYELWRREAVETFMEEEEELLRDEGLMDMSMEIIPATPATETRRPVYEEIDLEEEEDQVVQEPVDGDQGDEEESVNYSEERIGDGSDRKESIAEFEPEKFEREILDVDESDSEEVAGSIDGDMRNSGQKLQLEVELQKEENIGEHVAHHSNAYCGDLHESIVKSVLSLENEETEIIDTDDEEVMESMDDGLADSGDEEQLNQDKVEDEELEYKSEERISNPGDRDNERKNHVEKASDGEIVVESNDDDDEQPDDSATRSVQSYAYDYEDEEGNRHSNEDHLESNTYEYYDSNEDYSEENGTGNPSHFQHTSGNYSESDDYDEEDDEENNRRVAFEGEYDDEEGRGGSSSDGSVEVVHILDSSEDHDEDIDDIGVVAAEVVDDESSSGNDAGDETDMLNAAVDEYIDARPEPPSLEETACNIDEGKILLDTVDEYFAVSGPNKPLNDTGRPNTLSTVAEMSKGSSHDPDVDLSAVVNTSKNNEDVLDNVAFKRGENDDAGEIDRVEPNPTEDDAGKTYARFSLDGGHLGQEMSDDMNADDEHESLDTEDDKRSLAGASHQGDAMDEDEGAGEETLSLVQSHDGHSKEDYDDMMDQPSILVAAAMSSQRQDSSYQQLKTGRYDRASKPDDESFDNTDSALAPVDANLSEYDEASQDGVEHSADTNARVIVVDVDVPLQSILDKDVELIDSEDDAILEGGQLTDDGYQPDAEATEEEIIETKKTKTIDDGYVPDAEATEEETTKTEENCGPKSLSIQRKKRDVRFEDILERHSTDSPAVQYNDWYLPGDALVEEQRKEREAKLGHKIDDGYFPDGHTTDDTTDKRDFHVFQTASTIKRHLPPDSRAEDVIDSGYLPSAVEGTEEERSEEEGQEPVASVLIETKLVIHEAGIIAKENSLDTSAVEAPKLTSLSTQSIDEGYLPDGAFTEEERDDRRRFDVGDGISQYRLAAPGCIEEVTETNPEPDAENIKVTESTEDRIAAGAKTYVGVVDMNKTATDPTTTKIESQDDHGVSADPETVVETVEHDLSSKTPDSGHVIAESIDLKPLPSLPRNDDHTDSETIVESRIDSASKLYDEMSESAPVAVVETKRDPVKTIINRSTRSIDSGSELRSKTSSVRRSARLAKNTASSPNVPSSISTSHTITKAAALSSVPEDDTVIEETLQVEVLSHHMSSALSDQGSTSVASRTRRMGKRGVRMYDDVSTASIRDDETDSRVEKKSKRTKGAVKDAESEENKPALKSRGDGRRKVRLNDDAETRDGISELSASPPKTRRGNSKKEASDQEPAVRTSRRTRKTKESDGESSIASSRPRRSTRSKK